jgi:uncharacterized protein YjbI with pentapeptide repeats
MKKLLFLLALGFASLSYGYSCDQLQQLLQTKSCAGCDFMDIDATKSLNDVLSVGECQSYEILAVLHGIDASQSLVSLINSSGAKNVASAVFTGANLTGIDLSGAELYGTNFSGANLTSAQFMGTKFGSLSSKGASFYSANLTNANFTDATLIQVGLGGANMQGTNFTGATFKDLIVSLEEASTFKISGGGSQTVTTSSPLGLSTVQYLNSAILDKTIFDGVDLSGVDLSNVSAVGADFGGSSLKGTKFVCADLHEASFIGVEGVDEAIVSFANTIDIKLGSSKPKGYIESFNYPAASTAKYENLPDSVFARLVGSNENDSGSIACCTAMKKLIWAGKSPWSKISSYLVSNTSANDCKKDLIAYAK